jgi:HD superfamily phosphohydrolase
LTESHIRYDSLWRRIKSDEYATKLEGTFRDSYERLGELNNWGSLGWHYPHATATKLAHHHGVEHNALHFLGADQERERHRPSFRVASHVLHWGHLPLSYAGAEAIIRAIHVDESSRAVIEGIFDDVIDFGELSCRDEDHEEDCASTVLVGSEPFELYKWLSAWLLRKRWAKVWAAVKPLASGAEEETVKCAAVRALVCREDTGYELLDLCRLADYVPRDLQQAGTAWLTVDIEALWETSPIRPDRAQEWNLLLAARTYLEDRFFLSPEAQLVHSLASRAMAQGLLNKGITRENLLSLLTATAGDSYYASFVSEYHRRRLQEEVTTPTKRKTLHRSWTHVGTFERVRVPEISRLDVEDLFSERTGKGRLSYPMTSNFSVLVRSQSSGPFDIGTTEMQQVSITLHHRESADSGPARPALDLAFDVKRRQAPANNDVPLSLASWLSKERIELGQRPIRLAAGKALQACEDDARLNLEQVLELAALSIPKDPSRLRRNLSMLLSRSELPKYAAGARVLGLPLSVSRSKAGSALLDGLRGAALTEAGAGSGSERGHSLEAAVAADQLLSEEECTQRMIITGPTALASEGQPLVEWDIWRLDLLKDGDWRLVAIECSVAYSTSKEEKDRKKLQHLWEALHKRFSDLTEYRTLFAFLEEGELKYSDASRGFKRDP